MGGWIWHSRSGREAHYTGFVEGEERVLRSEVSGRVLDVAFSEGDAVPPGAVVARIDDSEIASKMRSKEQELAVLDAQIAQQEQQVVLVEETWRRSSRPRARSSGNPAPRRTSPRAPTIGRRPWCSRESRPRSASTRRARAATRREVPWTAPREMLGRVRAQEGQIAVAKRQLEVLRQQRELTRAQLGELEVQRAKHEIRAPSVPTVVQTQLLWPGELAQPGTPVLAVLDPRDKYVQIYVPVDDLDRVRVGSRVLIELDSEPGQRVPGEVSFLADQANFTPEKIETRSDRVGQVYRAKVRILDDVERFQPGTEGNVYLASDAEQPVQAARSGD